MPEEQPAPVPKEEQSTQEKKPSTNSNLMLLVGILLLLLLAGGGYLGWQMWQQTQDNQASTPPPPASPSSPQANEPAPTPAPAPSPSPITPSVTLKENIEAAINTMNTAALEGYMTNPVTVVLAASEYGGPVTPMQAVTDMNYLSGATDPWDWDFDAATLTTYENGFYGQYFPDGAVVGKSANNYVVSFTIDADGKISTIFMTSSADLLQ